MTGREVGQHTLVGLGEVLYEAEAQLRKPSVMTSLQEVRT
jgi:hypothetical protein